VRSRRGPRRARPTKLHADKVYDVAELRGWLRQRGIVPRLTRNGIQSSEKLDKHRWVIDCSIAWLFGYRWLTIRYERHAHLFCAFLTLAAVLTCYKKLAKTKKRHALANRALKYA
jgi:IS5 family transposase